MPAADSPVAGWNAILNKRVKTSDGEDIGYVCTGGEEDTIYVCTDGPELEKRFRFGDMIMNKSEVERFDGKEVFLKFLYSEIFEKAWSQ